MTDNPKDISKEEIQDKLADLDNWELVEGKKISKSFSFDDFKQALDFTNKVGQVAEDINHHPNIFLTWGKVKITIHTFQTNSLTANDFKLAQKIDQIDSQ